VALEAKDSVPDYCRAADGTVSFRISSDPIAQELIVNYMGDSNGVPLTCTSANIHGLPPQNSIDKILDQFGNKKEMITKVVDGGVREGKPSTVVRCVAEKVEVLRQGSVTIGV
jgi:tRNA A37 threonylcarbamoyladenosine synthetase subunit TsaC/SUA5/YrdC